MFLAEQSGGSIVAMDADVSERKATEPSEPAIQAVRAFCPEQKSDLGLRPNLFTGSPADAVTHVRGGLPPCVVRRVREYIDHNIDQRIRVITLAKLANLSVCYFLRTFKQSVGVTPRDYLIRRRVERTMELLSGTDMEIALAVGFADQSHCARRFRQHVGTSPREYRRSLKGHGVRPSVSDGAGPKRSSPQLTIRGTGSPMYLARRALLRTDSASCRFCIVKNQIPS